MATLTETARITRRGIAVGIVLIVLIGIGTVAWQLAPASQPQPDIVPTVTPLNGFGTLPPIRFPQSKQYPSVFKLETIEGGAPISTTSAYVYFIPNKSPTFFSRKNAEVLANKLGFENEPRITNETTLSYTNNDSQDTLLIDSIRLNFKLKRNQIDAEILEDVVIPSENQLTSTATNFLSTLVDWNKMLTDTYVSYFSIKDSNLVRVRSADQAQAVRIDYLTPSLNGLPIITGDLATSDTYVTYIPRGKKAALVIEASYQSYPPDIFNGSTYSTITGQQAWEVLQSGGGYIAAFSGNNVTVREGYFAYFQEYGERNYIQPVYVFEGDGGFVGIVSAIDPTLIGK